ncbi:MAG: hypothetical protein KA387_02310 [Rubrivivax sp.]|jgi:hypothetical protein|nr:hypothetical protein [Rubrivivax sp.]
MSSITDSVRQLDTLTDEQLLDLHRRVQDVDNCYRSLAEKMGQLYMAADQSGAHALTRGLDKPMRNASDNQRQFAETAEAMQMQIHGRA